jgi:uncharacterized protein YdeI (YjbR/CyaY-like superfamily)
MAPADPFESLQRLCLALPEATERLSHGEPTWFISGKVFVTYADHHHDDRLAFWCAAPAGVQEALVGSDPERFFVPPYAGHRGWIGVFLDVPVDWEEIAQLVTDAYRLVAPKRLGSRASGPPVMKKLLVTTREEWREWLEGHHDTEPEIWLVYHRKHTGEPRISYNDAVLEALCFGWIDSNQKGIDAKRFAQRFSPRKRVGGLSEMNKQRVRQLAREGKMTPAGMAVIGDALEEEPFSLAKDLEEALREDPQTWANYEAFPEPYRRLRIAFIEGARDRPAEFERRLRHFVKMTSQNKGFGHVKEFR